MTSDSVGVTSLIYLTFFVNGMSGNFRIFAQNIRDAFFSIILSPPPHPEVSEMTGIPLPGDTTRALSECEE